MDISALKTQIGDVQNEVQCTSDTEGCKDLVRRIYEIGVEVGKHDDHSVKKMFESLVVSNLNKASEIGLPIPKEGEVKT